MGCGGQAIPDGHVFRMYVKFTGTQAKRGKIDTATNKWFVEQIEKLAGKSAWIEKDKIILLRGPIEGYEIPDLNTKINQVLRGLRMNYEDRSPTGYIAQVYDNRGPVPKNSSYPGPSQGPSRVYDGPMVPPGGSSKRSRAKRSKASKASAQGSKRRNPD